MKNYLVVILCCGSIGLFAQNIEDGKKFLYNNRLTSAQENFQKMVDKDSKNIEAVYWLGQTYLMMNDTAKAKQVYTDAAQGEKIPPMIEVGLGHIDLLEGKKESAMLHFDNAIANSKTKKKEDPKVLGAIGHANADGPMEIGAPLYAVEKLNRAVALDPKNPAYQIDLGINFLKMGGERGGDAYKAFNAALDIDPNYALAKYRLGKIFQSQNNVDKFIGYYTGAVESDTSFAPAYLELYNYYSLRDVNKARGYLESYMANSDKDCNVDFFYGDYLFRSGKYQESLQKAMAMKNGFCKDYPRLELLMAYNYDRLGDTANARSNISSFMTKTPVGKISKDDYLFAASVFKKADGGEETAIGYLKTALEHDTVRSSRFDYMDTIASLYKKMERWDDRLVWLQKSYETNPKPSNFDVYNLGDAALLANNYPLADSMFGKYKNEYPDQIYGYLGMAKSAIAKDKDTTTGEAVGAVKDYIAYLEKTDTAKYRSRIFQNYAYLVYVHANVTKDYPAALEDLQGILNIDPENAYAKQTSEQIKRIVSKSSARDAAEKQPKPASKKASELNKKGSEGR